MKRITEFIKSNRVLFKNFTSLSILQLVNYLFPLITLPYVVRILGVENYGLVQFALALAGYFVLITDYGFNLSATKSVSINRENRERIKSIFSSVIYSKIILGIISLLLFTGLISTIGKFSQNSEIYFASFGIIIGTLLFPFWYFQGREKMHFIAIINFFPKLIGTIAIFIIIKKPDDFLILVFIYSGIQIAIGLTGLTTVMLKDKLRMQLPNYRQIAYQFSEGFHLFTSTISINLYVNSNIILLGFLTSDTIVGYYAAADKIRIASQSLLSIVSQSVYPHVNYLFKQSKEKFISFNKKLFYSQVTISFIISLTVFFLADILVKFILGNGFENSIPVLKILAWIPFVVSFSNISGIQTLLPLEKNKQFFEIVFSGAIICIVLALFLIPSLKETGAAISFLITEIYISFAMYIVCRKAGINYLKL